MPILNIKNTTEQIQDLEPGASGWDNIVSESQLINYYTKRKNALGFVNSEPTSPAELDIYVISNTPAIYSNGEWWYVTLDIGEELFVVDDFYWWNGVQWSQRDTADNNANIIYFYEDEKIAEYNQEQTIYENNNLSGGEYKIKVNFFHSAASYMPFGALTFANTRITILTDGSNAFNKVINYEDGEAYPGFSEAVKEDEVLYVDVPSDSTYLKIILENLASGGAGNKDKTRVKIEDFHLEIISLSGQNANSSGSLNVGSIEISDVNNLTGTLAAKASASHTHSEADITDLDKYTQADVDAKEAALQTQIDNITTLLNSDDTTLDELQEIADFIKQNKTDLDTLSTANIAGLQAALDAKMDAALLSTVATSGDYNDLINTPAVAPVDSVNGQTGAINLTASDVGLGSADNTSDADKPISTAQQTALDDKQAQIDNIMAILSANNIQ